MWRDRRGAVLGVAAEDFSNAGDATLSPDGARIAFGRASPSRGWEIRLKAADGTGPDSLVFHGPGLFSFPAGWSRNGRWLAYTVTEGATRALYVQSFPNPGAKYQVTVQTPGDATWSDRGDALLVIDENRQVLSIQVSTTPGFRQGATTRLFQLARGDFLVGVVSGEQRFLTATPKDISLSSRLEIVLGWHRLLGKK